MRSRRLPGSRQNGPTPPGQTPPAKPIPPPPPTLFDGELPRRKVTYVPEEPPKFESLRKVFGARSLLLAATVAQAGIALLLAPLLVRVLDSLSNNPRALVPLAALGALGVVLFGWGWLARVWGVAVTFCVVAGAWWIYFFAQSF